MNDAPPPLNTDSPALTIDQAIANLSAPDLGLRVYAAWWLGRFRVNHPEVVPALIAALDDVEDQTAQGGFPLRRNAARALAKLSDTRAVLPLIAALECSDFFVREAAAQALAQLGDDRAIPPLLQLLTSSQAAPQTATELDQPYDAIIEALGELHALDAIPTLHRFLEHPVERIQFATARALYQLTQDETFAHRLIRALEHPSLQLRRAALADLGAIGFLPAAIPIVSTPAENSLKLIALQSICQHHLSPDEPPSSDVLPVLQLMDTLL